MINIVLQFIRSITRYTGAWIFRLIVLWMMLTQIVAPRPLAILDEPQHVQTQQSHVCVHTRLIDEVEEWVIQRSLRLVREMGATTIVEFFPWAYIERSRGTYDWAQTDRIIRHASNQGLKVIARMGYVPAWAREDRSDDYTTLNYLPEESFVDFGHFVGLFAERYAGTVDQIIIWNEPNLAFEWGYRQVDPIAYTELLRVVYPIARQANPDITILAGALAPTLEPLGSSQGLNESDYLAQMYEAGAQDYFDALAVHTYGFALPADAEPAPDLLNFRRAELQMAIMANYGDDDKPIYITESGWNDHPRWVLAVRPAQRIAYTIDALEYARTHWPQVENVCIWALRYPLPTFSYPDNFTLLTTDFQIKPIYTAIQAYTQGQARSEGLWLPPPAGN